MGKELVKRGDAVVEEVKDEVLVGSVQENLVVVLAPLGGLSQDAAAPQAFDLLGEGTRRERSVQVSEASRKMRSPRWRAPGWFAQGFGAKEPVAFGVRWMLEVPGGSGKCTSREAEGKRLEGANAEGQYVPG